MRTSSAKAKGRRCASDAKDLLHKYAPDLKREDIYITPSGVTGPDLHLSPAAREKWNLAIECKNTESISIWAAFAQAVSHLSHCPSGAIPVLFYKRNRSDLMVTLTAEDFLRLIS